MTFRKPSRLLVEQLEDRLTPSTSQIPNEIPAGQFNWTQYSPNGTLGQLVWEGQTLIYQTWNGTSWQAQTVMTGGTAYTQPTYTNPDQMSEASQSAQLVYLTNGTPIALVLNKVWNGQNGYETVIEGYVQTASGWQFSSNIIPPIVSYWGPNNFVAEPGPHNSVSVLFTETSVAATGPGNFGSGTLWYGTNQSGSWVFNQIANTADLTTDAWLEGSRYAPRFLSMAITPSGTAYVTYTPEFYLSGAFGTVDSTLMLATNAGGSWQSQTVVAPINGGPGDAGLGASVAVAPDGQVAVASYYVKRYSTGSDEQSWLMYSTLNPGGGWNTTTAVSAPDGYVAGDGPNYTGFAPELSFNAQSQPTIVFSDEANQHLSDTYENEFSGQIRTTSLINGSWATTTILPQSDPLVNQLFFPVAATYNGVTVYAGAIAVSTLDSNNDPISTSFSIGAVFVDNTTTSPPVSPVSPPVTPVSPPPVSPPVSPVSPPVTPISPPPVSPPVSPVSPPVTPISPPPVSPPVSPVSPPPVTSPPVTSPPVTSPPVTSPPPVEPVLAVATAAGVTTVVQVTYSNGSSSSFEPFGSGYTAGATVALGDVSGDGIPDVVVASGLTGTTMPGTVQVYSGTTLKLIAAYQPLGSFGGGLDVAVGDVNGDGFADIVVGVLGGGWPVVTVINGATGSIMDEYVAYSTSFGGGVRIGVGDVSDTGYDDVVVGPGTGAYGLPIEVFSGSSIMAGAGTPQLLGTLVPFPNYTGAVSIAVGNLSEGGYPDIVVGTQTSSDMLAVYSGQSLTTSTQPPPLFKQPAWTNFDNSGASVALVPDTAGDGLDDLIVTNGAGTQTARYLNSQLTTNGWSAADAVFLTALQGINSPISVG
jgi:hypothetical protein